MLALDRCVEERSQLNTRKWGEYAAVWESKGGEGESPTTKVSICAIHNQLKKTLYFQPKVPPVPQFPHHRAGRMLVA